MGEILKFVPRPRTEKRRSKSPEAELLEATDRRIAFLRENQPRSEDLAACLELRDKLVLNFSR